MDIGMIIGIVGAIIGISALVVSILGLFYTRQRTKIMGEQLSVIRKETERKRTFEEASKAIRQAINIVKKNNEDFVFPPLDISRDDILAHMHDNEIQTLTLHIKPRSLVIDTTNGKAVKAKTVEDIIKTIKGWGNIDKFKSCAFDFVCDPNILKNDWIELGEAFLKIRHFYRAHKILETFDHLIDAFDHTILDEMKQAIDDIVKVIFNSVMSKHEITFSSTDKSEEILRKLENEIVDRETLLGAVGHLYYEICDVGLSTIQKEMFLKT